MSGLFAGSLPRASSDVLEPLLVLSLATKMSVNSSVSSLGVLLATSASVQRCNEI